MALYERIPLRDTPEMRRITSIAWREWTPEQMEQCATYYTERLRTHTGTMTLRPIQAAALHESVTYGGLFGPIRVGGGKTLLSLLAPTLAGAVRPLLLLPAHLIKKTRRDWRDLANHWRIATNIQIQSYETLGRENAERFLEGGAFDFIFADEAHRLKNPRAGVTRRVARYMHAHPDTRFCAVSGTLLKDDIQDFGHLLQWSMKWGAPLPLNKGELDEWSECLSTKTKNPLRIVTPGPLLQFAKPGAPPAGDYDGDEKATARRAFRRRLLATPGVIASGDGHVACSLYINATTYEPNGATEENFRLLRESWTTPDGWTLSQAVDIWRHAQELALGFHYVWDPRPPQEWLEARRLWAQFVRQVISRSHTLDTELVVRNAVIRGDYQGTNKEGTPGIDLWRNWQRVEPTFTANPRAIWHDDGALKLCAKWAKEGPGIIWVAHTFFGHALAEMTGLDYYGQQGERARDGGFIDDADPRKCIIASVAANSTGRNLQAWNRNLLTAPPAGAPAWEQLLGRTHRDGQQADQVTADVLIACREHFDNLHRAIELARVNEQTIGHSQKLLIADIDAPSDMDVRDAARRIVRWQSSSDR